MASTAILSRLFLALSSSDLAKAREIGAEIASDEEQKGHRGAANILRGSLNPNGRRFATGQATALDVASPSIITEALSRVSEHASLDDVMLRKRWRNELRDIVAEWQNRKGLAEMGIRNRSRLLFYGPSGCGKSLAAKALGSELSLPTYVVRFDSIIGAYLGQTAIHLRELFRFAENNACVLVFDEIDALGKKRGNPLDVGELDRIVIALMQELEFCRARGLVIASTNLARNLDSALWRRFDSVIEFPLPSQKELSVYATRISQHYGVHPSTRIKKNIKRGVSYARVEQIIQSEARHRAVQTLSGKRRK